MGKSTITFRLDTAKREALDTIAEINDRDRSYVLNEAVDAYLGVHDWQVEHIKKGLKQAQSGKFAGENEVRKAFARWRR
ncbi:MAG: CopG family ribbon-helix-helix protein [Deltaproteobacteria bacterium]